MILDIDAGNSRLKWRLSGRNGVVFRRGSCINESDLASLDLATEAAEPLERVRVGSVRGVESALSIRDIVQRCWRLSPEFALPVRQCAGVTTAYEAPQALGVDRWLAVLAAFNDCRHACCVVDAGSAATFDVVSGDGLHLGGYIVPGLSMQRRSLAEGTAMRLPSQSEWPTDLRPGVDTTHAVHGGILAMLVDWVQYEFQAAAMGAMNRLYVTGGDAMLLSPHLTRRAVAHTVVPDLVLDGLARALP